jgi:hypothetical protein
MIKVDGKNGRLKLVKGVKLNYRVAVSFIWQLYGTFLFQIRVIDQRFFEVS